MKKIIGILTLLLWSLSAYAQGVETVEIYFEQGSSTINKSYLANGEMLNRLRDKLGAFVADSTIVIDKIKIDSYTSPDGDVSVNSALSSCRAQVIYDYIRAMELNIPDSLMEVKNNGVAWGDLRQAVAESDMPNKESVMQIIDEVPEETWDKEDGDEWLALVDSRNKHLMDLKYGRPYRYMKSHIFPNLRRSSIVTLYFRREIEPVLSPEKEELPLVPQIVEIAAEPDSVMISSATLPSTAKEADPTLKVERILRVEPVERELKKNVFAYKGEWLIGLTASYYTFSTEDTDFLIFIDNITADFGMTTIKPFGGYFYRDNRLVGMRLGYSYVGGTLSSARLDLGENNDLQFDMPYIHSSGNYVTASVFHRSYTALDRNGHFGLFAEVELSATGGSSIFEYSMSGSGLYTRSDKMSYSLSFNPGMSVFIMNNVSTSVSFEFGGINYTKIKQYDELGESKGSRDYSDMNFTFNFLAINLGVTVHLWKK